MAVERNADEIESLVNENQGLIGFCIRKFGYIHRKDKEDLWQEGLMALMDAAKGYDPERGAFSTYAVICIVRRLYMVNPFNVKVGPKMRRYIQRFRRLFIREMSEGRIRNEEWYRRKLAMKKRNWFIFRKAMIVVSAESADILGHDCHPKVYNEVVIDRENAEFCQKLLDCVPGRDGEIVAKRFGFIGEAKTLEALGQEFGLTRERIRQIEAKALETMRLFMEQDSINKAVDTRDKVLAVRTAAKHLRRDIESIGRKRAKV